MKQNFYSRKIRQLKGLSKKLQTLQNAPPDLHSPKKEEGLLKKIRLLVKKLQSVFSGGYLRRILGPVALLAGLAIAQPVTAQSFAKPVKNPFGIQIHDSLSAPAFADLDHDGDMDMLVGGSYGHLYYYQNTGAASQPAFAPPVDNPFGLDTLIRDSLAYVVFPAFADLDGDGDMDLLLGKSDGSFEYFQNKGDASNPSFAPPVANPFGLVPLQSTDTNESVFAAPAFADLDGDGDLDLLVGAYYGKFEYFENTGTKTNPQFAAPVENPFQLVPAYYFAFPAFADVDNDGDMDMLVGEYYGNLEYYQNTGTKTQPAFASPVKDPFGLDSIPSIVVFPAFADLDGDGDMDLMVGDIRQEGDTLALSQLFYFENTFITGVQPPLQEGSLTLYPNPVSDKLTLESAEKIRKVEIFDLLGRRTALFNHPLDRIRLSSLKPGIYQVKITFEKGNFVVRKISKR